MPISLGQVQYEARNHGLDYTGRQPPHFKSSQTPPHNIIVAVVQSSFTATHMACLTESTNCRWCPPCTRLPWQSKIARAALAVMATTYVDWASSAPRSKANPAVGSASQRTPPSAPATADRSCPSPMPSCPARAATGCHLQQRNCCIPGSRANSPDACCSLEAGAVVVEVPAAVAGEVPALLGARRLIPVPPGAHNHQVAHLLIQHPQGRLAPLQSVHLPQQLPAPLNQPLLATPNQPLPASLLQLQLPKPRGFRSSILPNRRLQQPHPPPQRQRRPRDTQPRTIPTPTTTTKGRTAGASRTTLGAIMEATISTPMTTIEATMATTGATDRTEAPLGAMDRTEAHLGIMTSGSSHPSLPTHPGARISHPEGELLALGGVSGLH